MAKINFSPVSPPTISLDVADIKAILQKVKAKEKHLAGVSEATLTKSLVNAVTYLLQDRWSDGLGKGGWGRSEATSTVDYYGPEALEQSPPDSMWGTALIADALYSAREWVAPAVWSTVQQEHIGYLLERWEKVDGSGGILRHSKLGEIRLQASYRHSAWLLKQWLLIPGFRSKALKTAEYLIRRFDPESLLSTNEKVATVVAAHSAFTSIRNTPDLANKLCQISDLEITPDMSFHLKDIAGILERRYVTELQGWGLESNLGDRQVFTLFALAELSYLYHEPEQPPCVELMDSAMNATLTGKWLDKRARGVSRWPSGPIDISLTCLAFSALFRKPAKSDREFVAFIKIRNHLLDVFSKGEFLTSTSVYSWCLSYFVKDLCGVLNR